MHKWTTRKIQNLPFKCDKLTNYNVINSNDLSWTIQKYVRTTEYPELIHKLAYKMVIYPIVML